MSTTIVGVVRGSESRETTSHPFSANTLPMLPVPEKSSNNLITLSVEKRVRIDPPPKCYLT